MSKVARYAVFSLVGITLVLAVLALPGGVHTAWAGAVSRELDAGITRPYAEFVGDAHVVVLFHGNNGALEIRVNTPPIDDGEWFKAAEFGSVSNCKVGTTCVTNSGGSVKRLANGQLEIHVNSPSLTFTMNFPY